MVHVNYFSAEVDTVYFPQIAVIGDVANAIWQLRRELDPQAHWNFGPFDCVRARLLAHSAEHVDDERFPIHPVRLVAEVGRAVGENEVLCLDNGMYKFWFGRYQRARHLNTMLLDDAHRWGSPRESSQPPYPPIQWQSEEHWG